MLTAQLMAAMLVLTGAAFAPPAQGRMLLVPMLPGAAQGIAARAVQGGMTMVGRGPFAGSFVVSGDRAAIAAAMLRRGVLIVAAPAAGCDPARADRA